MTWDGLTPPYATIVADPPWPHEHQPTGIQRGERGGRPKAKFLPYSTMTINAIAALPVHDLSTAGSHLYLWTTNHYLTSGEARAVVLSWGFTPVKTLVWCKQPMGLGQGGQFTNTTEFVIFAREPTRAGALIKAARQAAGLSQDQVIAAVRPLGSRTNGRARIIQRWEADDCLPSEQDWMGLQATLPALAGVPRPEVTPSEVTKVDSTWWQWKRGAHSAKPPAFLDLVEQVSPAPRVELFARAQRLGWDSWGWGYEGLVG